MVLRYLGTIRGGDIRLAVASIQAGIIIFFQTWDFLGSKRVRNLLDFKVDNRAIVKDIYLSGCIIIDSTSRSMEQVMAGWYVLTGI